MLHFISVVYASFRMRSVTYGHLFSDARVCLGVEMGKTRSSRCCIAFSVNAQKGAKIFEFSYTWLKRYNYKRLDMPVVA